MARDDDSKIRAVKRLPRLPERWCPRPGQYIKWWKWNMRIVCNRCQRVLVISLFVVMGDDEAS